MACLNIGAIALLFSLLVAIVIDSPLAYYFMQQWLSDFVYRIDINGGCL